MQKLAVPSFYCRKNKSVTKHIDLKTKNLLTKSHTETRIRIKLLGSHRCPMSSADLSPAVRNKLL